MREQESERPLHVVVVGGGIGALEAVLALDDLAADRVRLTLIGPEDDFAFRPMDVAAPFARGHVGSLALTAVMKEHGGGFVRGSVVSVDTTRRIVNLTSGAHVSYDVLVLSPGAERVAAFSRALTVGKDMMALTGILADLEQGWSHSVAFVVPAGCSWPLPLYELALMTAQDVWSMNIDNAQLHIVSPEHDPLEIFGAQASAAVRKLLGSSRIRFHGGSAPRVLQNGRVETGPDTHIDVDRIVALPHLRGPQLAGVPADTHGFIPVDSRFRVIGAEDVYAVGDAADRPIKQGGLTCQQADIAAAHIARRAGADVGVPDDRQVLRGRLLTGGRDRFLERAPSEKRSDAGIEPLWFPPLKVSGRYLTPYLAEKGIVVLPASADHEQHGIEVEMPLAWDEKRRREDILGLAPLGPTRV